MTGNKTEDLYTTADVARTRQKLLEDQQGRDALTGLEIPPKQAVLDHNHRTQFVRGVLHRQTNAVLGKIENLWTRYLSYWYNDTLSNFLRKVADYLEKPDDTRYVHPGWLKRVEIDFKKLPAAEQTVVLSKMKIEGQPNGDKRVKAFVTGIKTQDYTYLQIKDYLKGYG